MRIKIAILALMVFLVSSAPAHAMMDVNLSFVVNVDGLKDAAKSLNDLTKLVNDLSDTDPNKGRLLKLLAAVKKEVNDMIKTASDTLKDTGKDITKDLVEKYLEAKDETMKDIRALMKESFKDTRVLLGEFLGGGQAIPAQLNEIMKSRIKETGFDLASFAAGARSLIPRTPNPLADVAQPIDYRGTKITNRIVGYQDIAFAIDNAPTLSLKIGEMLIPPREVKAGSIVFRLPMNANLSRKFDDTEDRLLAFQLVDPTLVGKLKKPYGGFLQLYARFPLSYEFTEFPLGGKREGIRRVLDVGTGINALLDDWPDFGPVAVAARHGEIYALAKTRLACGAYTVQIGQGSGWKIKVKFPDGKEDTLVQGKPSITNSSFGGIIVTGPNTTGDVGSLLIDIKPKE